MAVSYIIELTILFFKKGSFGTGDSVVQNFCPQRLIEHKQGHAGILKGDPNLFTFSRIPFETEIGCRCKS